MTISRALGRNLDSCRPRSVIGSSSPMTDGLQQGKQLKHTASQHPSFSSKIFFFFFFFLCGQTGKSVSNGSKGLNHSKFGFKLTNFEGMVLSNRRELSDIPPASER